MTDKKKNEELIHHNYKFDDSAVRAGRKKIGVRIVGEKVEPKHMTYKEYVHYLCYLFGFKIGKGWDGVEKNKYQYNWTAEESHNVETVEEALKFLGIKKLTSAPDGIEKRNHQRRNNTPDNRKDKTNRRTKKQRRQDDIKNHITYYVNILILLAVLISWGAYSVYLYIEGLK